MADRLVLYEVDDKVGVITLNRPEKLNAINAELQQYLTEAFARADADPETSVVLLRAEGRSFCAGYDISAREPGRDDWRQDPTKAHDHLHPQLEFEMMPWTMKKPVIAAVQGHVMGGGCELVMLCDLTIAADNAKFGQSGPRVGSFDAGFGSSYLARVVGHKKAREIWFLCQQYDARAALEMGLVNAVVPLAELEATTVQWCREMLAHSPTALRFLKMAMNADCDGQAGMMAFAGSATLMYYTTDEGREGKEAFLEKRLPDFSKFPRYP